MKNVKDNVFHEILSLHMYMCQMFPENNLLRQQFKTVADRKNRVPYKPTTQADRRGGKKFKNNRKDKEGITKCQVQHKRM